MTAPFTAACVQLASDIEPEANVAAAAEAIRHAREGGADFVLTPETTDMMEMKRRDAFAKAKGEGEHPGLAQLSGLAGELGCWLLIGSLVIRLSDERLANRSFLIDPAGRIAARYDKIHMFDVEVPDGQSYRESKAYRAGGTAVLADLPWGRLGLSVCYDLRFAQIYRALAQAGAAGQLPPGMALNQGLLSSLLDGNRAQGTPALQSLVLNARDGFNIYGSVTLDTLDVDGKSRLERLVFGAPAIYGYGSAGDVTTIPAMP